MLPVALALVEDASDDGRAIVHPLCARPDARVLEIHDAQDWLDLVETYPSDVTWSRGHNWQLATGWAGSWALPDWASVAQEWDGVHLSVVGYLKASGRLLTTSLLGAHGEALAPGPSRTLLAGWGPGQTYWLADVLETTGHAQRWDRHQQEDGDLGWLPGEDGQLAAEGRPRPRR